MLAIDVGRCSSRELKWFFNLTSSACQAFNYTGCRGNPNRFNSKAECRQTCEPHRCEPPRCGEKCQFGSVKDVNGCDTCQCIKPCEVNYSLCYDTTCHMREADFNLPIEQVDFDLSRLPPRDSTLDGRWTRKPIGLSRVQPIYLSIPCPS